MADPAAPDADGCWIDGVPSGPRPGDGAGWRARVAAAAAGRDLGGDGLAVRFALRPRQFVDLDTLVQTLVAGLRDAGVHRRGLPGLDVVVARKAADGGPTGALVRAVPAAVLGDEAPPGPAAVEAAAAALPGPRRPGKAAWRGAIAAAWGERPPLDAAAVWAEVRLAVPGSLLAPLEPVLDALEPVLGRDPRGRPWQEFFPNDDRITWLRVARAPSGEPAVRLRLGPVTGPSATFRPAT